MNSKNQLVGLLKTTRPNFLILTPACLSVVVATSTVTNMDLNWWLFLWAVIGAVLSHIAVNALNEYEDFNNGLDFLTARTPFSGGSGTLPGNPELVSRTAILAVVCIVIVMVIGCGLIIATGVELLWVGLPGVLLVLTYSRWIVRSPWLCLIAPGLSFGPLMMMGVGFVLTGEYSLAVLMASLPVFFLTNNLLLLNQFPDINADKQVGRRVLPVVYGRRFSLNIYSLFLLLSSLSIVLAVMTEVLPVGALLGLINVLLAWYLHIGTRKNISDGEGLLRYLGLNVLITLLTPVLMAVGIISFS